MFEESIFNQLCEYFKNNDLLPTIQYGFQNYTLKNMPL